MQGRGQIFKWEYKEKLFKNFFSETSQPEKLKLVLNHGRFKFVQIRIPVGRLGLKWGGVNFFS